jgi:DNA-binding NarL/FixJ family response regulator
MRTTTVLVVHEHRIFAEAIARRLDAEPGLRTGGIAATPAAASAAVDALGPDVAVLDMDLGGGAAGRLLTNLVERRPPVRVVALVGGESVAAAVRAVRLGATAVSTHESSSAELVEAVLAVAKEQAWIPPHLLRGVLAELRASVPPPNEDGKKIARLTPRERQILDLMMLGCDRATIARECVVSLGTVRTHTKNILAKLEVHSSLQAVAVARRAMEPVEHGALVALAG